MKTFKFSFKNKKMWCLRLRLFTDSVVLFFTSLGGAKSSNFTNNFILSGNLDRG